MSRASWIIGSSDDSIALRASIGQLLANFDVDQSRSVDQGGSACLGALPVEHLDDQFVVAAASLHKKGKGVCEFRLGLVLIDRGGGEETLQERVSRRIAILAEPLTAGLFIFRGKEHQLLRDRIDGAREAACLAHQGNPASLGFFHGRPGRQIPLEFLIVGNPIEQGFFLGLLGGEDGRRLQPLDPPGQGLTGVLDALTGHPWLADPAPPLPD